MRRINLIVITLFFIISFYFLITLFITAKTTDYGKNLSDSNNTEKKAKYVRDVDIEKKIQSSSEFSWISNFAGNKLTKSCKNKERIEDFINQINKIKFHERVLYVIIESELKDNLKYLTNSFDVYGYPYMILGMGQDLEGYAARMIKLRDFLRELDKNSENYGIKEGVKSNLLIVYCDVESLAVNSPYRLSTSYHGLFGDSIVFMANKNCQPERDFANDFPPSSTFLRYLNHKLFIGPYQKILRLFEEFPIPNSDYDEQLYFVEAFLTDMFDMKIDYKKDLFGPLAGFSHISDHYKVQEESVRLKLVSTVLVDNLQKRTSPFIVNANGKLGGHSRPNLKMMQNLFPSTKTNHAPYLLPPPLVENTTFIESRKILFAIYLHDDFPFFEDFMKNIENLDYDKKNIVLYINYYYEGDGRKNILDKINSIKESSEYKDIVIKDVSPLKTAKKTALYTTNEYECDYYFTTDSILSNKNSLKALIAEDKPIVTPLLNKHGQLFSNFWGDITHDSGNYKDYPLYNDIITKKKVGIFGGTVTWGTYLIKASEITERFGPCYQPIRRLDRLPPFSTLVTKEKEEDWYVDILFSYKCSLYSPVFVINREKYGHLIEKDVAKTSAKSVVDLFLYEENEYFWRKKYFSKQFFDIINQKSSEKFAIGSDSLDKQCKHYSWKFFKKKFSQDLLQVVNADVEDFQNIWKSFYDLITEIVSGHTIKETYIWYFFSNYTLEIDEGISSFIFPLSPSVDQNGCTLEQGFGYFYERPKNLLFNGHGDKKYLFVIEYQPE